MGGQFTNIRRMSGSSYTAGVAKYYKCQSEYFFHNFLSDKSWHFTNSKDADDGNIKSVSKEEVFLPEIGWTYYDPGYFNRTNFDNCKTIG